MNVPTFLNNDSGQNYYCKQNLAKLSKIIVYLSIFLITGVPKYKMLSFPRHVLWKCYSTYLAFHMFLNFLFGHFILGFEWSLRMDVFIYSVSFTVVV